ncbi:GHKL domain-containing protein [Alloscardovia omnicolens]|uniref:sensor histidine kinase n=1 Tax=Alloscardovia omnicolens TaxID=419015 RepID=UPI003A785487
MTLAYIHSIFTLSVRHGYILQILLAELMFLQILGLNILRPPRKIVSTLCIISTSLVLMIALPNIISWYISGLFSLTIFCISVAMWCLCFRGQYRDILFCCVAAQLTQNLSYNTEGLIYAPFSAFMSPVQWFFLSITCTAIIYAISAYIFVRTWHSIGRISINSGYVIVFAVVSALFVYVLQYLFQVYHIDQVWVSRLPLILCCVAGLSIQFGFIALRNREIERVELERIMRQEARQYQIATENMNTINLKAHDLKHQVMRLREAGTIDSEELRDIEQAIEQYENMYETGNAELDTVLNQKTYLLRKHHIDHTVIADGTCLSFMRPADILSLFGNLLDNALEHEQTIENIAQRYVGIRVYKKADMVVIRVENYCVTHPHMRHGLPVTTKSDSIHHGFGMKSIQYIVQRYGGSLHIGQEGDSFVVNIVFADLN